MRKLVAALATITAALVLSVPMPASAAPVRPASLSGCAASLINANNATRHGGHSYCSSGQTSGIQRVKVYCFGFNGPGSNYDYIVYGSWTVAKQWSTAWCGGDDEALQAQFQTG